VTFSPDYIRLVLNENFEDAKMLLLEPMLAIHAGHLAMLADCGIVTAADARALRDALRQLDVNTLRSTVFTGDCEDLFFHVERLLSHAAGPDTAGRLHTARSRNDMAMAMYRMHLRGSLLALTDATLELRRALTGVAALHTDTIFPAHTHTQPAQPTTLAHYLLAVVEELERHTARLRAAYASTNRCPLGACAITGTGFAIDRARTAAYLGFDSATGNTFGSIASVDYLLESAASAANVAVGMGRFTQDMLLWCTQEMGYLRLSDAFVQTSSIMPQKRNPVALEHARSLLSKAFAELQAIPAAIHNTPFGDIVDTEDDLQPLVADAFKDAVRGVRLLAAALADAEFDVARMAARARTGWVTVTELADTLVRDHGLPFAAAHAMAARVINERRAHPDAALSETVASAAEAVLGRRIEMSEAALSRALAPEHFVAIRETPGGPGARAISEALTNARLRQVADDADVAARQLALATAAERLNVRLNEL
jgi:argininosuccinate lyase